MLKKEEIGWKWGKFLGHEWSQSSEEKEREIYFPSPCCWWHLMWCVRLTFFLLRIMMFMCEKNNSPIKAELSINQIRVGKDWQCSSWLFNKCWQRTILQQLSRSLTTWWLLLLLLGHLFSDYHESDVMHALLWQDDRQTGVLWKKKRIVASFFVFFSLIQISPLWCYP